MVAIFIGDDQIGRVAIVELVDLEPAVEHRHIPFQEIDEDPLAILEHRPERVIARA